MPSPMLLAQAWLHFYWQVTARRVELSGLNSMYSGTILGNGYGRFSNLVVAINTLK